MAEKTAISWADATFNPWIGCTKVGPGCDDCYAARDNERRKWVAGWGPGVPRKRTSGGWKDVARWNRNPAILIGGAERRPRIFSASLADIFDNEVPNEWRADFWKLVADSQNLQFLIVTKRIGNAAKMLPSDWGDGYGNAVIIATVVNQEEADRDIPKLMDTPARSRGISVEPMLGPMDISRWTTDPAAYLDYCDTIGGPQPTGVRMLDWVICGGESGAVETARLMKLEWAMTLREQCRAAGTPFHFKQVGNNHAGWPRITGKGKDPEEWPVELRVQDFPR